MAMSVDATAPAAMAEPDDRALAARARDGERAAFAMLVERHYDFIHRVAWKWSRDRSAAEDIAQGVCMRLGSAIRSWRGEGAFTTWLYRLTINAAHDHARAQARERRKAEAWGTHTMALGEAEEDDDDTGARLWEAVQTLPDKQRDAVLLVFGEGLGHAEAAAVMDCAEGTVSYHVHEAKKRLKCVLREAGED